MKDSFGGKKNDRVFRIETKTYDYFADNIDEKKKEKDIKKCAIKWKLKFKDSKLYLEENQLKNKINHSEKSKLDLDSLKLNHKEFIQNKRLKIKSNKNLEVRNKRINKDHMGIKIVMIS